MDLRTSSQTSVPLPRKQTRSNVRQSKYGCYTCRSRRVKCDEIRPACTRCHRAGKLCEGYRLDSAFPGDTAFKKDHDAAQHAMDTHDTRDSASDTAKLLSDPTILQCSRIGLDLLGASDYEHPGSAHSVIFNDLLPRLCRYKRSLTAAAAALGAAYQAYSASVSFQGASYISASVPYDVALTLVYQDISGGMMQSHEDAVTTFLASVILAGAEALQRNLSNALKHVRGALRIYNEFIREDAQNCDCDDETPQRTDEERSALEILAKELDMQTVTYMLSIPLQVSATQACDLRTLQTNDTALFKEPEIVSILHACYSFCSEAREYRYYPQSLTPPDLLSEQSAFMSLLEQCLLSTRSQPRLKAYRTRCLAAMIYSLSILSPHETIFDSMYNLFSGIVDTAESDLPTRSEYNVTDTLPRFRRISTLCQPLFLTATKCRDPNLRRKAIDLLSRTGKEGPWDSELLVPIAMRAVEIEEKSLPVGGPSEHENAIPESARLHNCGMGHMTSDTGSPVDGMIAQEGNSGGSEENYRVIEFRFWRCIDIDQLIAAKSSDSNVKDDDVDYWTSWDERIEILYNVRKITWW